MPEHEFRDGDRVLIAGTYRAGHGALGHVVIKGRNTWCGVENAEIIPDDRRPDWLPGQPGDVAEWGGERWMRGGGPDNGWYDLLDAAVRDDDVPADAVLVLPAKTREQTP